MKLWRPVVGVIVFSTLWETFLSAGYHTIKEVPRRTCQKPHVSRLSKTCSFHPNHKCQSLQPAAIPGKSHGFSAKSTRAPRASSTKTSIFFLGASIVAPRKAALGPRKSNNFAGATRWSNGGATRRWDLHPSWSDTCHSARPQRDWCDHTKPTPRTKKRMILFLMLDGMLI